MNGILLGLALAVGAPALKDLARGPSVIGEWVVDNSRSTEYPGELHYTFTPDGRWLASRGGKDLPSVGGARGYSVAPRTTPPSIDLVVHGSAHEEARLVGVYKIEGDTLTICGTWDPHGNRPTTFDTSAGKNLMHYVMRRVKPKD